MADMVGLAKQWVEAYTAKKDAEEALKQAQANLGNIEAELLPLFEQEGVQSLKVDGFTVYLHTQIWAGVADGFDKTDACTALKNAGLGEFVQESFNTNTLSSYVRELNTQAKADGRVIMDPHEILPEALQGVIKVTDKPSVRARKA